MREMLSRIRVHWIISMIYFLNLILSLHYYLILYTNSSFLEAILGKDPVAFLYIIGAFVGLTTFILTPRIIGTFGMWTYLLFVIIGEFATVFGLALVPNNFILGTLFVLHQAFSSMIFYALDVYLEEVTQLESKTGEVRGLYLTISNLALVISPILAGFLIEGSGFPKLYLISALLCVPLFLISYAALFDVVKENPKHTHFRETLRALWKNKNVLNVSCAHLVLQLFYAWMVVYVPIYLIDTLHFEWKEIGMLFTIMLLPFVLLEIPAGLLSDKRTGEKEIMIGGFLISAVAVFMIPYLGKSFIAWAVILFISRVGASLIEITTESYFFKKVSGVDSDTISIFRMLRSVSYLIAPCVVVITLQMVEFKYIFWVLSLITVSGVIFARQIEDTL